MNVALSITRRDVMPFKWWAQWVAALGGVASVKLWIGIHKEVWATDGPHLCEAIGHLANAFSSVERILLEDTGEDYPNGANDVFIGTMEHALEGGDPVLWMESDLIPVRKDWFARICQEYGESELPYMGVYVDDPPHMNGTGVYPITLFEDTSVREYRRGWPWDCHIGEEMLALLQRTDLIQHNRNQKYLRFNSRASLSVVDPRCVLYHPSKDCSLIQTLNTYVFGQLIPPDVFDVPMRFYEFQARGHPLTREFDCTSLTLPNCFREVYATNDLHEQCKISVILNRAGVREITEEEYNTYIEFAA